MDDGLLNKTQDDQTKTSQAEEQESINKAVEEVAPAAPPPSSPPVSSPPPDPVAPPSPPSSPSLKSEPISTPPIPEPATTASVTEPLVKPDPAEVKPEIQKEEPEMMKPEKGLKKTFKKAKRTGVKIGAGVLMLTLIVGGVILGRDLVQQRQVVEKEATGGCAGLSDVGTPACASWTEATVCKAKCDNEKYEMGYVADSEDPGYEYLQESDCFPRIQWQGRENCETTLGSGAICSAATGGCVLNPGASPTESPVAEECTYDAQVYCVGNNRVGQCYWGGQGNRYACWKLQGTYGVIAHSDACNDGEWHTITGSDGVERRYKYIPEYGYLFMLSAVLCQDGDVLPDGRNTAFTCSDRPEDLAQCPSSSPTPTPTPTPTPPADEYSCVSLSGPAEIGLGDTATFSCEASFSAESPVAYFRYKVGAGEYIEETAESPVDTVTKTANYELEIDEVGTWVVQCRVCTDTSKTNCTSWGAAN